MEKVGFVSLGCPKNLVDGEVMMEQLRASEYEITPRERARMKEEHGHKLLLQEKYIEGKLVVARNMRQMGLEMSLIAAATELSEAHLRELLDTDTE